MIYSQCYIYFSANKECVAIDAREAAPSNAHQRMFVDGNPPPSSTHGKFFYERKTKYTRIWGSICFSFQGGLSIAIPGEIAGFWEAHRLYGKLPWRVLFKPAIDMCNEGIEIQKPLAFTILKCKDKLWKQRSFRFVLKKIKERQRFSFLF